jgi:hypothetical protein
MKIILPDLASQSTPSQKAAEAVFNRLENHTLVVTAPMIRAIRSACSRAYTDAMNGGRGDTVEEKVGELLIRVTMGSIDRWEVEIYTKLA